MSRRPRNWSVILTGLALALLVGAAYAVLAWALLRAAETGRPAPESTVEPR